MESTKKLKDQTGNQFDSGKLDAQILIIDNDNILCELFISTLKQNGFSNVVKANSGIDAMKILGLPKTDTTHKGIKPDIGLIITDIVLPEINGLDLCKKIKRFYPNIPVMLISGHDIHDIHKKILDANADDFMSKPFNMIELITRVNILLAKYRDIPIPPLSTTTPALQTSRKIPYIGDKVDSYLIVDSIGLGKTSLIYKVMDTTTNE